jgi:hypothetical protein
MSKASDEFELMVTRIHEVLEGENAQIEWNERIPDPDNPSQSRQIDVTVRKGELFNIIECRLHKKKQDVKWIEELIGRRLSLEADSVTAVSSSGFTSGAIKKARRYGVILNDIVDISSEYIAQWARSINITLLFYKYESFDVKLKVDAYQINRLDVSRFQKALQKHAGFKDIFTAHLDSVEERIQPLLKENRQKKIKFIFDFILDDFTLNGIDILAIETKGVAFVEEIKLAIPGHIAYGNPNDEGTDRCVFIQKYNLGNTRVIHSGEDVSISLDLSELDVPPYWQFRYVELNGGGGYNIECFELVDPHVLYMKVDMVNLSIAGVCKKDAEKKFTKTV